MIHPTVRAAVALGVAAPLALGVAFAAPGWWVFGPVWLGVVLAAIGADALGLARQRVVADVRPPGTLHVGEAEAIGVRIDARRPVAVDFTVDVEGPTEALAPQTARVAPGTTAEHWIEIRPHRRGSVRLTRLWLRTEVRSDSPAERSAVPSIWNAPWFPTSHP